MEKILAILYLIGVFFTALMFISFYVSEVFGKWKKRKSKVENNPEPISEPEVDVVGKSMTSFFAPLMSEAPEREPSLETEPDISPDEVEVIMSRPYVPDDEELEQFANDDTDISGDFSQGLTYQQICHAVDMVHGKKSGEDDEIMAGKILSFMSFDFLDVICKQVDHENNVKKLLACWMLSER